MILSQLLAGFAQSVAAKMTIGPDDFCTALGKAMEMAYQAVMQPVEGTILTVSRGGAFEGGHRRNCWKQLLLYFRFFGGSLSRCS